MYIDNLSKDRILQVFIKARTNLPAESLDTINTLYRDYILERGDSVTALNRKIASSTTTTTTPIKPNILKRVATDEINSNNNNATKQARFDA
jgi:hypothetical protein